MAWMTIEEAADATGQTQESIREGIATGKLRIDTSEHGVRVFVRPPSRPEVERFVGRDQPRFVERPEPRTVGSVRRTVGMIVLIALCAGASSYFLIVRRGSKPTECCAEAAPSHVASASRAKLADANASAFMETGDLANATPDPPYEAPPIDVAWMLGEPVETERVGSNRPEGFGRVFANRAIAGDPGSADEVP